MYCQSTGQGRIDQTTKEGLFPVRDKEVAHRLQLGLLIDAGDWSFSYLALADKCEPCSAQVHVE